MHRRWFVFFLFILSMLPFASGMAAEHASTFSKISLKIGKTAIQVELAKTESQRAKGLMFRTHLGVNSGMLFDFGAPAKVCMWMKNTYIPLSVAFIDQDGVIVNIENMEPLTIDSHCSNGLVRYALEMNHGWFVTRKISPGGKVKGFRPD